MTNNVAILSVYFVASNSLFSASLKLMTFQIALRYCWRVSHHSLAPDDKGTHVGLDVVILLQTTIIRLVQSVPIQTHLEVERL